MTPHETPTSAPPQSEFHARNLWTNGWGARLVAIGCLFSFVILFDVWDINQYGGGSTWTRYGPTKIVTEFFSGTTLRGSDNAFAFGVGWYAMILIGASLVCAARRSDGMPSASRWVPIGCALVLGYLAVNAQDKLHERATTWAKRPFGGASTADVGPGPNWMIVGQIVAGLGGVIFAFGGGGAAPPAGQPAVPSGSDAAIRPMAKLKKRKTKPRRSSKA
jgi:hypothetical protein